MRMNPYVQTLMPFYNFFNNALQRLHEFSWKAKLSMEGRELPEMTGFEKEEFEKGKKHIPEVLGGFLTFGVIVSLVEQAVDPLPDEKRKDWIGSAEHWAKILARGPTSMIPGVRDLVNGALEGREPSGGLIGSLYTDITKPLEESGKVSNPGRTIRHWNAAFGALTGLSYEQAGKVGQYIYNVQSGRERPKTPYDWYLGVRHGTQVPPRR